VEAPPEYPPPNRNLDRLLLSRVTGGSACAVVTQADASAALDVPAPRGFAASHIENAELGGGRPVGAQVLCRYLTSVGEVNAHIQSYASARSQFAADQKQWWPTKSYAGIGEGAFYAGGGSLADLQETGRLAVRRPTPPRAGEEGGRPTLARSSPGGHPKGNMHPLC